MPVFWATLLNIFFILILAQISPAKTLACTPSLFFKPNLVLARFQEIPPTDSDSLTLLTFHKVVSFKGTFSPNFFLVIDSACPNCGSTFEPQKLYLLSLESTGVKSQFRLPECQQILTPISGLKDTRLILNLTKTTLQPLWASLFLLALFISSFLDNFLPPVIAIALSIIILLEVFGWSVVLLIRHLRR